MNIIKNVIPSHSTDKNENVLENNEFVHTNFWNEFGGETILKKHVMSHLF